MSNDIYSLELKYGMEKFYKNFDGQFVLKDKITWLILLKKGTRVI